MEQSSIYGVSAPRYVCSPIVNASETSTPFFYQYAASIHTARLTSRPLSTIRFMDSGSNISRLQLLFLLLAVIPSFSLPTAYHTGTVLPAHVLFSTYYSRHCLIFICFDNQRISGIVALPRKYCLLVFAATSVSFAFRRPLRPHARPGFSPRPPTD